MVVKLLAALAGATILAVALPCAAQAQPITGLYIGSGLGYNAPGHERTTVDALPGRTGLPASQSITADFNGGVAIVAAIGYGLGHGVRLELEGDFRSNAQSSGGLATSGATARGTETTYGVMGNALYDISVGRRWIFPYVGGGVGYQFASWRGIGLTATQLDTGGSATAVTSSGAVGALAYQGIAGVSFPIGYVPGLAVTVEYRYLDLAGTRSYSGQGETGGTTTTSNNATKARAGSEADQTFLVGFRYAFNPDGVTAPPPTPAIPFPVASAVPAPPQAAARVYMIFFDFDKAELTPRARDIVAEAVRNSARVPHTRIEVGGHADRSGDAAYNQRISQARADAVVAELGRWGVPRAVMDIHAYGDSRPLVQTPMGVKELQNRRVEIVYR